MTQNPWLTLWSANSASTYCAPTPIEVFQARRREAEAVGPGDGGILEARLSQSAHDRVELRPEVRADEIAGQPALLIVGMGGSKSGL